MRRLTARWTQLTAGTLPGARSSFGLSALRGRGLLFGGEKTSRHAIDSKVYALDVADAGASWKAITPSVASPEPVPRVAHAQCVSHGQLVIFGGRTGLDMGEGLLNDLWLFDVGTGIWAQPSTAGTPPAARSFHQMAALDDKIYVFGGCGADGRLATLHELDRTSWRWSTLPHPPGLSGRGGASFEAASDGHALWVACGFTGAESNDLMRFDRANRSWTRAPSEWLRPRSVSASFSLAHPSGPLVCLFGGEVSPSDRGHEGAGGFAADLVALDVTAGGAPVHLVIEDGPQPQARGWAAATAISDREALLFGGLAGTDEAPLRLDDTWLLRLD
jgi:hypothetical protein